MKSNIIRFIKRKINKYNVILNINKDITKNQKKVVIVYIHNNFINKFDNIYHTQIFEATQIVKAFINRDYEIDIINCHEVDAINLIYDVKYDVIFGLGDIFYKLSLKNPQAKKILYLTENHPDFSLKKERERVDYYNQRHGTSFGLNRTNLYFKKEYFEISDYVIAMGNTDELLNDKINFHSINPTGLMNEKFIINDNNIEKKKKTFIWFGSNGAIHKGLDVVYEVFSKRSDIKLYICGLNSSEAKKLKIKEKDNIFILGKVNVQSDEFLNMCSECCWIIYPSCSEAMSTAVLTCMRHALIPIVIKENGFEKLDNNAIFLENFTVEYIDQYINKVLEIDDNEVTMLRKRVYEFSNKEFTIEKFTSNINNIMEKLDL